MEQGNDTQKVDVLITDLKLKTSSKNLNNVHSDQLTENEKIFLKKYPTFDKVYKVFGPSSWRYALEKIDKAVHTTAPSLNRLNAMYNAKDADVTLFTKHFVTYYLMAERSSKQLGEEVCNNVAALFLGRNGEECTPVKLLCYFANYSEFKESFRDFDPEDVIIQYSKKFKVWWGNQVSKYYHGIQKPQSVDVQPCGVDALKLTIRKWIEDGEDPREHTLYKVLHIVTDEMIGEVRKEIALGVF